VISTTFPRTLFLPTPNMPPPRRESPSKTYHQ